MVRSATGFRSCHAKTATVAVPWRCVRSARDQRDARFADVAGRVLDSRHDRVRARSQGDEVALDVVVEQRRGPAAARSEPCSDRAAARRRRARALAGARRGATGPRCDRRRARAPLPASRRGSARSVVRAARGDDRAPRPARVRRAVPAGRPLRSRRAGASEGRGGRPGPAALRRSRERGGRAARGARRASATGSLPGFGWRSTYMRDAFDEPGVSVRLHGTTLYNSIYRYDDELLVNTHAYGVPAGQSPVLHLRRFPGGRLFDHYMASFERVWADGSAARRVRRRDRGRGVGVGRRIDYLDDPDAPAANSLVPSVNVAVVDERGSAAADPALGQRQLGVARRRDGPRREHLRRRRSARRRRRPGVDCEITGLVGIYTNPRHVILYTSDGEVRQECSVVFSARAVGGEPTPSSESSEVRWVPPGELARVHDASVDAAAGGALPRGSRSPVHRVIERAHAAGRTGRRVEWPYGPGRVGDDARRSAGCRRSGIAGRTRWVSSAVPGRSQRPLRRRRPELLIAAAYLHDIGYAPELEDTGFHPLDGARWLRAQGQERLACLVAHHSGAWFEAEARGLARRAGGVPRGAIGRGGPPDVLRPDDRPATVAECHVSARLAGDRQTVRATTATSRAACAPRPDRSRRSWRELSADRSLGDVA